MPDILLKIQKNQVHFYPNTEVAEGVYKDELRIGLKPTAPAYEDLPTYGITIQVDPGVTITCGMIQSAIQAKVEAFMEQRDRDIVARNQMGNCPGVTEDPDWFYVTITV